MNYRLNTIYPCVQGEGCQTGVAMVLVRLHGCGVGCPWCDTKETWHVNPLHCVGSIDDALGQNPRYTVVGPYTLAAYIRLHFPGPKWVLLTGGEPADQELAPLIEELHLAGYKVAVETSGTATGMIGAGADWVCVSPKIDMPGGRRVLAEAIAVADEIKMVVGKAADVERLDQLLAECPTKPGAQICLQPMSQNERATALCIETVQARGWRLSAQLHKYLRLP